MMPTNTNTSAKGSSRNELKKQKDATTVAAQRSAIGTGWVVLSPSFCLGCRSARTDRPATRRPEITNICVHRDTDLGEVLLKGLCDAFMAGAFVGQVVDVKRSLRRELAVLVELEAGFLQKVDGFFLVDVYAVVAAGGLIFIGVSIVIGLELAAVAVAHTGRDEGSGSFLLGLTDGVDDVLTVDKEGKSASHLVGLVRGLALEHLRLDVETDNLGTYYVGFNISDLTLKPT